MKRKIQTELNQIKKTQFHERCLDIFDLSVEVRENSAIFHGEVLQRENLTPVIDMMKADFPALTTCFDDVQVLLHDATPVYYVNRNLTSMHREKTFNSELTTQLMYGDPVALLKIEDQWALARNQLDGYISYTYIPYLADQKPTLANMMVRKPVTLMYEDAERKRLIGRLFGGTRVALLDSEGKMARVAAMTEGWVKRDALIPLDSLPGDDESLRKKVCKSALKLIGVPYLWGGTSPLGIDCSGVVQYAYRMVGIQVLRDAHMQLIPARVVEPPFLPGDVVLYGDKQADGSFDITHASLSLGGWTVIHSSRSRNGVYIDDVQSVPHLRDSFAYTVRYIGE